MDCLRAADRQQHELPSDEPLCARGRFPPSRTFIPFRFSMRCVADLLTPVRNPPFADSQSVRFTAAATFDRLYEGSCLEFLLQVGDVT